jgi:hypothetical protein
VSDARLAGPAGAVFSADRNYRYALWRTWAPELDRVLFVGLNPSTADEVSADPTLRRCAGFARAWGHGGVLVGNLFAYCATHPVELRAAADPVGPDNDAWLERLAEKAARLVVCWGNHGALLGRDRQFSAGRDTLLCLRRNRNGSPAHPLYIRRDQTPGRWRPVQA